MPIIIHWTPRVASKSIVAALTTDFVGEGTIRDPGRVCHCLTVPPPAEQIAKGGSESLSWKWNITNLLSRLRLSNHLLHPMAADLDGMVRPRPAIVGKDWMMGPFDGNLNNKGRLL